MFAGGFRAGGADAAVAGPIERGGTAAAFAVDGPDATEVQGDSDDDQEDSAVGGCGGDEAGAPQRFRIGRREENGARS